MSCSFGRPSVAVVSALVMTAVISAQKHQPPATAAASWDGAEAYYTTAQAERGAIAYAQRCEKCHAGGYKNHVRMKFQGKPAYPGVYYLWVRMQDQPIQTTSITQKMRADIVAFLLQTSGFPAGQHELVPDSEAMKLMPLDEPGFTRFFNGKDLSGFTFVSGEMIGNSGRTLVPCTKPAGCVTEPA